MKRALLAAGLAACAADAAPAPQCSDAVAYRIDRVDVPDHSGEGHAVGIDLDGDGNVDNALGNLLSGAHSEFPALGSADDAASAHMRGDVTWLVTVAACDDGLHVEVGDSGGGDAVPVSALVDVGGGFAPIVWMRPAKVASNVLVTGDELEGVIAFAVPMPDAARTIAAPFLPVLNAALAQGDTFAAGFDGDHDGTITIDEVLATDLAKTMLAPDLQLGAIGAWSGGVGVHATRVAP